MKLSRPHTAAVGRGVMSSPPHFGILQVPPSPTKAVQPQKHKRQPPPARHSSNIIGLWRAANRGETKSLSNLSWHPPSPSTVASSSNQEASRPPVVDSRAVKRMLACPPEEMHVFSDPKNYRTTPRFTRFALPFRETQTIIQARKCR